MMGYSFIKLYYDYELTGIYLKVFLKVDDQPMISLKERTKTNHLNIILFFRSECTLPKDI